MYKILVPDGPTSWKVVKTVFDPKSAEYWAYDNFSDDEEYMIVKVIRHSSGKE